MKSNDLAQRLIQQGVEHRNNNIQTLNVTQKSSKETRKSSKSPARTRDIQTAKTSNQDGKAQASKSKERYKSATGRATSAANNYTGDKILFRTYGHASKFGKRLFSGGSMSLKQI